MHMYMLCMFMCSACLEDDARLQHAAGDLRELHVKQFRSDAPRGRFRLRSLPRAPAQVLHDVLIGLSLAGAGDARDDDRLAGSGAAEVAV